jgi:hypothetical protein
MTSQSPHSLPAANAYPHGPVVRAQDPDTRVLSQVIADAFHDLPPSKWLIPDDQARRDIFPGYFRIYVEHAMASGTVHTTTDQAAVALWLFTGAEGASPQVPGPVRVMLGFISRLRAC